jgi:hypothetical protein
VSMDCTTCIEIASRRGGLCPYRIPYQQQHL